MTPMHEYMAGIGFDALVEIFLMIISLLVCITAHKVHSVSKDKSSQMLSLSFLLLTIAYAAVGLGNLTLFLQQTMRVNELFFYIIHYSYLAAKTLGLLTLACIPLKITNLKVYGLMAFLVLVSTYAAATNHYLYQTLSIAFYIIIISAYGKAYYLRRNKNTLLLTIGFILLAFGAIMFACIDHGFLFYILGHATEFAGYVLILIALLLAYTFHHEKRKNKNYS